MSYFGDQDNLDEASLPKLTHRPKSDSGSSFAASDKSTETFAASSKPSVSVERPLKRKPSNERTYSQTRLKRLRVSYNDKYRQLYNTAVEELSSLPDVIENHTLSPSQIGAIVWTAEEKEILFSVIARKGRHHLKAIAAEIGSKSEPEVSQYIEMLREGFIDAESQFHRPSFVKRPEFDAALEISPACSKALDFSAEALSILQQKEEEKAGKSQHGELWLLTPKIATRVDQSLGNGGEGEKEVSQALPAGMLLNLGKFLHLSKRFFMNSSDSECNWRSYTEKQKYPTINFTAFSDFHTLAISITKRLVQSSLFFAMSRLRAMESSAYSPKQHVRQEDVFAALDVLRMKGNAKSHWVGVARRCRLRVFENTRNLQASGRHYSYDEVEEILDKDDRSEIKSLEGIASEDQDMTDWETAASDSPSESASDNQAALIFESDDLERATSTPESDRTPTQEEIQEQLQDEYMEAIDQIQSQAEETRLWELLGEDPSEKMDLVDIPKPKAPASVRKEKSDLVDWTSWVDYSAEWEMLERPARAEAFHENRRVRKGGGDGSRGDRTESTATGSERGKVDAAGIVGDSSDKDSASGSDRSEGEEAMDAANSSSDEEGSESVYETNRPRRGGIDEDEGSDDDESS